MTGGDWRAALSVALFMLPAIAGPARAWGPEAHRTIALIADRVLQQSDPAARAKLMAVLATDKENRLTKNDIASEATWADMLRSRSPEARTATSAWHVVPFKPENPDLTAACAGRKPLPAGYPASHGPQDNCAIDKIIQFTAELKNPVTTQSERLAAVQFLLNLVGELNDPLLTLDRGDQIGECVALQIGSKPPVRLATYWDDTLVREVVGSNPAQAVSRIMAGVAAAEAQKWAEGSPESWAQESYEIAKSVIYGFATGEPAGKYSFPATKGQVTSCASVPLYRVGAEYETKALAAVKQQLAKAGLRLAAVLRDTLK